MRKIMTKECFGYKTLCLENVPANLLYIINLFKLTVPFPSVYIINILLEFVARVQHHSCGYVDKLSDRKVVNICSVTRDVLQLSR